MNIFSLIFLLVTFTINPSFMENAEDVNFAEDTNVLISFIRKGFFFEIFFEMLLGIPTNSSIWSTKITNKLTI